MRTKRIIIAGALAALLIAYGLSILPHFRHRAEWKRTAAALQQLRQDRVASAVEAFVRDHKTTASTVPLSELVSGGYLRAEEIRGLEQPGITVSVDIDETAPGEAWIRVPASDGTDIVALADGSITKVPRR